MRYLESVLMSIEASEDDSDIREIKGRAYVRVI